MWNSAQMRKTSIFRKLFQKKREFEFKEIFLLDLPSQEYCLYLSQPRILTAAQNRVAYANNLQLVQLQRSRN